MRHKVAVAVTGLWVMLASGTTASAVTTFQFSTQSGSGNAAGNSLSMVAGGITVTETAWWLNTTAPVAGTTFGKASLDAFSGNGLGVCNPAEGVGCSNPNHQVDNSGQLDFILLAFSSPVNLSSIVLNHFSAAVTGGGEDADMTFWTLSSGLTTGSTYGGLGAGTTFNNSVACSGSGCLVTDNFSNVNNVSYLLVAAATPNPDATLDSFKLQALNVSSSNAATPEPASMAMMGSGLLACAAFLRRRKKQHSK